LSKKKSPGTRVTLTEKAYDAIKGAILLGDIPEGTFLSEYEIRRAFGISRTPFREACNRLLNEQVLDVMPHRGYFVPELSFRSVRDIFETRLVLEAAIAEFAATRAESGQLKELESIEKEILSHTNSKQDYEKVVRGNTEFHLCLARMTQNQELVELASRIFQHMERLSYLEYRRAGFRKRLTTILHGPIIEAIRRRDPNATRKAIMNDIAHAQLLLTGMLPENQSAHPAVPLPE
jgi:DNA-binding GntR family transcriptional regulator